MKLENIINDSSDIAGLFDEIESRFPVDEWVIEGIRVWPLVRIRLYLDLTYGHVVKFSRGINHSGIMLLAVRLFKVIEGLVKYMYASVIDFGKNRQPEKTNVVFLSDGVSYSLINGRWYEKYCEPFIEYFSFKGIPCFLMTQSNQYFVPRNHPSKFIQPHLDYLSLKSRMIVRTKRSFTEQLPGFDDFFEYLKNKNFRIKMPTLQAVRTDILLVRLTADFLKKIMKKKQASLGLTVSYYGISGCAFNLACRELGIPSVDIQHGSQGDLHPAYGRWNRVPSEGYELLPSLFWCWSDYEAEALDKWTKKVSDRHNFLKGGNLWLDQWMDDNSGLAKTYDDIILKLKGHGDNRKHIIVIQTGGIYGEHFLNTINAVKNAPGSWFWWIRIHPCELYLRNGVKKILKDNGISNANVDEATDLPLYALLRHMDCNVTTLSSTVIEAEMFGVPSVVTHGDGVKLYQKQISSGAAIAAFTPKDIIEAVKKQMERKNNNRPVKAEKEGDNEALSRLLRKSHRVCFRCVMDTSAKDIVFDDGGLCNFCGDFYEKHRKKEGFDKKKALEDLVAKIKKDGRNKKYDCVFGVSGGIDSSYGLFLAKEAGLRILAVHLDNGWNSGLSVKNIANLVKGLGIDLYTHVIDWDEYRDLMESFFRANVIDVELLTDNAILSLNYRQADKYGIKYILSGTNTATEGMRMPSGWNWCKYDRENIKCVHEKEGSGKIKTMPLIGVRERLGYELIKGIKWISFLDYFNYDKSCAVEFLKKNCDFIPYPYKHYESVFTRFYQGYILPQKSGVDKRRLHLSNLICSGQMNRDEALKILDDPPYSSAGELEDDIQYFLKKMDWKKEKLDRYLGAPVVPHLKYKSEKWIYDLVKKVKSYV